jgi:hypothetical protein
MTDRICPLNNRACRCDPNVTDKNFRPCALTKRIGKLIRLFGSSFENEATAAALRLRKLLPSEDLTFNDLGTLIENCDSKIEEKKYSDSDAEIIYAKGVEKGRAEEARKRPLQEPTEFYDDSGQPQWHAIALYCQRNYQRLEIKHREFIDDMAGNTLWREPTSKQGKYLLSLFLKLGNGQNNERQAAHLYR